MKFNLILVTFALVLGACSSSKFKSTEHEDIERDYEVKDSSSNSRPGWIEDANGWAGENDIDTKSLTYYSFETTPKVSRQIACDLAKARARADIAGEIATEISKQIDQEVSGNPGIDENNPDISSLKEFVDSFLSSRIQRSVYGAKVSKTYWEKRFYQKDLGAKKDFYGHTCAVFVSISKANLNKSIAAAQKELERVQKTRSDEQKKFSREEIKEIIDRTRKTLNKE